MSRKIKLLTIAEEAVLTKDELTKYYEDKVSYYKRRPVNRVYLGFVKAIRKGLVKTAAKMSDYEIIYLNDLVVPENGYIVATNHKGFNDIPILIQAIGETCHILMANDVPMPLQTKFLLFLLGSIMFSRANKEDRQWALDRASKLSAKGYITAYYPESVNNFTESLLLYPFWPGIIDNAKNANKPIIPLATHEVGNKAYVSFGKPFVVEPHDDRLIMAAALRNEIATLLWGILELFPIMPREDAIKAYKPPNFSGDGVTFVPEYESQYVYRHKNPFSPDNEQEMTVLEVFDISRNIKRAESNDISDMSIADYQSFDMKSAQEDIKEKQSQRIAVCENQIGNNKHNGSLRTLKQKTGHLRQEDANVY